MVTAFQMLATKSSPQGRRIFLNAWLESSWWCYGTQEHLTPSFVTHHMWKQDLEVPRTQRPGVCGIPASSRQHRMCLFNQKGQRLCAMSTLSEKLLDIPQATTHDAKGNMSSEISGQNPGIWVVHGHSCSAHSRAQAW